MGDRAVVLLLIMMLRREEGLKVEEEVEKGLGLRLAVGVEQSRVGLSCHLSTCKLLDD